MNGAFRRARSARSLLKRALSETSRAGERGRKAERALVWMLGSPRTGSTWLLNLLTVHPRVVPIDEPGIGYHLGLFVVDVMGPHPPPFDESRLLLPAARAQDRDYFFASRYRSDWRPPLRALILERFGAQLRDVARERRIDSPIAVIKEPAGSQVAEFLFSVLPASRLLFLVRDPRDVLDSELDAVAHDSWLTNQFGARGDLSVQDRMNFLRGQAHRWLARTETIQRAFDRLPPDQRHLVRYEDLRADTVSELRGVLQWLLLDVDEERLRSMAERLSFDALPDSLRGRGKFARAAAPGMWRENLTPDEQAMIDGTLGETMATLGY